MASQDQLDQLVAFLAEKFEQRELQLKAVARSVTHLADGLSSAEKNRRSGDQEIREALISILGVSGESLNILRADLSKYTVEELADMIPHSLVCAVRTYQHKRGEANVLPAPLPPVPLTGEELEIERKHSEDSLVFRTHKDGTTRVVSNIKAKTLAGWIVAIAAIVWNIIHTWQHGGK